MIPIPAIGPMGEPLSVVDLMVDPDEPALPDEPLSQRLVAVCLTPAGTIQTFGARDLTFVTTHFPIIRELKA